MRRVFETAPQEQESLRITLMILAKSRSGAETQHPVVLARLLSLKKRRFCETHHGLNSRVHVSDHGGIMRAQTSLQWEVRPTMATSQCGRQSSWLTSSADHLVCQYQGCRRIRLFAGLAHVRLASAQPRGTVYRKSAKGTGCGDRSTQ